MWRKQRHAGPIDEFFASRCAKVTCIAEYLASPIADLIRSNLTPRCAGRHFAPLPTLRSVQISPSISPRLCFSADPSVKPTPVPISCDILDRRADRFLLWCPRAQSAAPQLVLGQLHPGNPPTLANVRRFALSAAAGKDGLFEVTAAACALADDTTYHYWFEVDDSRSSSPARIVVTDPFATCVDWRVFPPGARDHTQPAAVIHHVAQGKLADRDPGGESAAFEAPDAPDALPPNNRLVIYELPVAWALSRSLNQPERAVATFADAAALVDERVGGANFAGLSLLDPGNAYLVDLGVNAVELLPPADSFFKREWGYDTAH